METLGNILHTVGEKVGIVAAADEKKDEGAAPPAPAPASGPGPTEPADHAEKRGIFGSIAEAAKNVLAPPPLEVDPGPEEIEPIAPSAPSAPEKKEEKPVTFLGDLLQKVEHKIEETLPYVSPLTEKKKVDVSAFGSVFDPQEDASGKVTPPSVPRVISETKPAENPLGAKLSAPLRTESAEGNTSVMAEWAGRTKDLSGIDKADLQRVQDEVDKVVKQSTADRRTSISAVSSSSSTSSVEKNKNKNKKKNRRRHQKEQDVDVVASDVARRANYEKIEDANEKLLSETAKKEAAKKEAAEKEAAKKEANDKLRKEAAEKEAATKEAAEKLRKEAAEKEAATKEAAEKLRKEAAKKEAATKEAAAKLRKEAAEKEAAETEAAKKEAAKKEAAETEANDKLRKEAAEKEAAKEAAEKEDKTPVVDPAILADVLEKVNDIIEPTLPKLTPEVAFGKPSHERHPAHQKHPEPTRQLHERTPAAYDRFQPAHSDQA